MGPDASDGMWVDPRSSAIQRSTFSPERPALKNEFNHGGDKDSILADTIARF